MLIPIQGSNYFFTRVQTPKRNPEETTRFYIRASEGDIFVYQTTPHQFDHGSDIVFAIQKQKYIRNKNRIDSLFSGTNLYLLEEQEV